MDGSVQQNIDALYARLKNKTFQETQTSGLTTPYYLYCYDADKEYEIAAEIENLTSRLKRPDNFLDVPVINIFDLFVRFLKETVLGPQSIFEGILNLEKESPQEARSVLTEQAASESFFEMVEREIQHHLKKPDSDTPVFVFIMGWGQIFPYLRSSRFLNYFEKFNRNQYKLIIFYPGAVSAACKLFNLLDDQHPYRVNIINAKDLQHAH